MDRVHSVAFRANKTFGAGFSWFVNRTPVFWVLAVYAFFLGAYVYLPVIAIVIFSFNEGGMSLPFTAFTFEWYEAFLQNDRLISAVGRSLQLAVGTAIVMTFLATTAVLGYRANARGRKLLFYLILLGVITPGVTFGIANALYFNVTLGFSNDLLLALPIHVVYTLPFGFILLLAGFSPDIPTQTRSARIMGASNWEVFRHILLPQVGPVIFGVFVFGFTLSYNEATRIMFVTGRDTTVPLELLAIVHTGVSPELFAFGAVTTVVSVVLLTVSMSLILINASRG